MAQSARQALRPIPSVFGRLRRDPVTAIRWTRRWVVWIAPRLSRFFTLRGEVQHA